MATFTYNQAKERFLEGNYDPTGGSDSHFIALVMSNTTADTEYDAATLSAFSTFDEHDGSSYDDTARVAVTMAASAVQTTGASGFSTLASTASTASISAPGVGTRNSVAVVLYVGTASSAQDSTNFPVAYFDLTGGGSGFATNASSAVVVQWNASGILKMA